METISNQAINDNVSIFDLESINEASIAHLEQEGQTCSSRYDRRSIIQTILICGVLIISFYAGVGIRITMILDESNMVLDALMDRSDDNYTTSRNNRYGSDISFVLNETYFQLSSDFIGQFKLITLSHTGKSIFLKKTEQLQVFDERKNNKWSLSYTFPHKLASSHFFTVSSSSSSSGNYLIVGDPLERERGGVVQVFRYRENVTSISWQALGTPLYGDRVKDDLFSTFGDGGGLLGLGVDISHDGKRIVVAGSKPQSSSLSTLPLQTSRTLHKENFILIFDFKVTEGTGDWSLTKTLYLRSSPTNIESTRTLSFAMTSNGDRLVVGPMEERFLFYVYDLMSFRSIQTIKIGHIGENDMKANHSNNSESNEFVERTKMISMSGDGKVLCLHVGTFLRLFRYNAQKQTFKQLGSDMLFKAGEYFSTNNSAFEAMTLSLDGNRLGLVSSLMKDNKKIAQTSIYTITEDSWVIFGTIPDEVIYKNEDQLSGFSISLSYDGGRVAVNYPYYNDNNIDCFSEKKNCSSQIRIYELRKIEF